MDAVTENPALGAIEVWEMYNTTGDAHPMHIHEVVFEVANREGLALDGDDEVVTPSSRGDPASRTRSSPIPGRSRACGLSSTRRVNSCGIATSSSTRTTR
jgi:FtsP/CotA-like multicopper oxidase with cupredoxin domain